LAKYVVILVVALLAAHLLLSRNRPSSNASAARKSLHKAFDSTARKTAIAVGSLIAVLMIILLVQHLTS
jgi:predicted ferric reductase